MVAQRQAHRSVGNGILREGIARHAGDPVSHKRLRRFAIARGNDRSRTFVADGKSLAVAALHTGKERLGHLGHDLPVRELRVLEVRRAEQQGKIAWINRRGFHLDQHLIARGLGKAGFPHFHRQRAIGLERGENLLSGGGHGMVPSFPG